MAMNMLLNLTGKNYLRNMIIYGGVTVDFGYQEIFPANNQHAER